MNIDNSRLTPMPNVAEVYQRYDIQRRLQLMLFVGPIFGLITGILTIYTIQSVYGNTRPTDIDSPLPVWLLPGGFLLSSIGVILFFVAGYIASRQWVTSTSITIAIAVTTTFVILTSVLIYYRGLAPNSLVAYIVVAPIILIVGVTGTRPLLILVTFLMNFFTIILTYDMPRASEIVTLVQRQAFQICLIVIIIEWSLTLVLLALMRVTNQTISTLRDITIAYERARQLDDLKNQFITSVNHELRTPVMVVQSNLQLLQIAAKIMSPAEQQVLVDSAVTASDNLSELITSILDSRQIDQAKNFKPAAVSLLKAVQSAVAMIPIDKLDPGGRDLFIHIPPELQAWVDGIRLQQILINLLTNAVKYSDPGTKVEISAQMIPAAAMPHAVGVANKAVEIRVRDYGFGVPPEQVQFMFQRFVRLPRDLASTISGNGLGLYLCRTFIENMGGRIWVESSGVSGEGSTFYIHLPIPETTATIPTPAVTTKH